MLRYASPPSFMWQEKFPKHQTLFSTCAEHDTNLHTGSNQILEVAKVLEYSVTQSSLLLHSRFATATVHPNFLTLLNAVLIENMIEVGLY